MRVLIAMFLAALLAGCCVGGYPPMWSADQPPFNAFQAGMKLAVGMPTDESLLLARGQCLRRRRAAASSRDTSGHATS
jgi:hypothetical protein